MITEWPQLTAIVTTALAVIGSIIALTRWSIAQDRRINAAATSKDLEAAKEKASADFQAAKDATEAAVGAAKMKAASDLEIAKATTKAEIDAIKQSIKTEVDGVKMAIQDLGKLITSAQSKDNCVLCRRQVDDRLSKLSDDVHERATRESLGQAFSEVRALADKVAGDRLAVAKLEGKVDMCITVISELKGMVTTISGKIDSLREG